MRKVWKTVQKHFLIATTLQVFSTFWSVGKQPPKRPFYDFPNRIMTVNDWCCKRDFFCKSVSISCALFSQDQFLRSSGPVYLFKKDWNLMNTHTHPHTTLSLTDHLLPHKLFDRESERERERERERSLKKNTLCICSHSRRTPVVGQWTERTFTHLLTLTLFSLSLSGSHTLALSHSLHLVCVVHLSLPPSCSEQQLAEIRFWQKFFIVTTTTNTWCVSIHKR